MTRRQTEIAQFIRDHVAERGYPPTVREIGGHLHIGSSAVQYHLDRMVTDGVIVRDATKNRTIRVVTP